ncbi:MAG: class I SAM-dependent methyltransferase [Ignavibacteria bacterium]
MKKSNLSKDVLAVIKPKIWDYYYYVSILTRKAYEKVIPGLLKENKNLKILDYGCGVMPYKHLFEGYIGKYTGVDVGNNPKAEINIQSGETLPFMNDEFDIVLSSQVLEHVKDVEQYMNECYRVLKNNGYLLLSTHGTWQYHASPYDYHRWTSIGLKNLLEIHNFEVEECTPILGQLALTSQLRINFYYSSAAFVGTAGKILLAPVAMIYQIKMMLEDLITPKRVKQRDSAIFLMLAKKKSNLINE